MFHQATLSKLHVRTINHSNAALKDSSADEWVDTRKYNPYELVASCQRSSPVSPQNFLTSHSDSHIQRTRPYISAPDHVPIAIQSPEATQKIVSILSLDDSREQPFELDEDEEDMMVDVLEAAQVSEEAEQWQETPNWENPAFPTNLGDIGLESPISTLNAGENDEMTYREPQREEDLLVGTPRGHIFAMEIEPILTRDISVSLQRRLQEPGPSAW
jgi:hypothetical protein